MSALSSAWLDMYRERERAFGVLSEAQWRVLLDLYHNGCPLPVTSCCIASGAPMATALRHIGELVDTGFINRELHPTDRRAALLSLSATARDAFGSMIAQSEILNPHAPEIARA